MTALGRAKSCAAFTVVELVIVVSLLSLAALVAMPDARPSEGAKLDLAASEFADAMRFARSEAMRTGNAHAVRLEKSANRLRVLRLDTGASPPAPVYDVRHPVSKRLYTIDLDDYTPLSGVAIDNRAPVWSGVCDVAHVIGFDASGTPRCSDPYNVVLQGNTLTLAYNGSTIDVVLDGETGRVTVQ